jgi:hypothetical protein
MRPSKRIKTVRCHKTLGEEEGKLKEELDVKDEGATESVVLARLGPGRLAINDVKSPSSLEHRRRQGLSGHSKRVS